MFDYQLQSKQPIERGDFVGWQADSDPGPGEMPGQGECRPAPPAGFRHGGAWAGSPPSAALAAAVEAAAGPEGRYEGAETDDLVGIARQWAAIESWAAAGKLGALRAMMREDGEGTPLLRRRTGLPEGWDDSLNYEVAGALAMGPVSAGNLASLAWTLGARLPGIGRLLAGGTLTLAKAKLIAAVFEPLDEGEAARAEALVVGEVAGKTYFQVERLAWRAALAVAPDVAERRRSAAERERARVTVFREESGAVGLSGRDLPAAQALAGHANVVARAGLYEASGAFPGQSTSGLQALAYLHLLNGVTAGDAIAFARTAAAEPPDDRPDDGGDDDGGGDDGRDDDGGPGDGAPDDSRDDDGGRDDGGRDGDAGDGDVSCGTAASPAGASGNAGSHGDDQGPDDDDDDPGDGKDPDGGSGPGNDGDSPGDGDSPANGGGDQGGGDQGGGDGGPRPGGGGDGPGGAGARLVLPEVTVPLVTLQGRAARAGENRLLGPLDPAMARDLAAAAARSPSSRWELTVVDEHGYAVGHGIARPGRGRRQQRQPPPGLAGLRVPSADQHHRHRDTAAAAGGPGGPGDRAALRRPAGRVGPCPASSRRLGTYPARRPGTGRAVRRGAHARLRPPARGRHLRAEPAAAPPDPGPRSRVHVPALFAARARLRF